MVLWIITKISRSSSRLSGPRLDEEEGQMRVGPVLKSPFSDQYQQLLNFASKWVLNKKGPNGNYAPPRLFQNPIPRTTPDVAVMDSLFHGLWLVRWWSWVNISALRLSGLSSPLCSIDLFAHSSARTTSVPGRPSITDFNTVQMVPFLLIFFIFLGLDSGWTGFGNQETERSEKPVSFLPSSSWTAGSNNRKRAVGLLL